MLRAMPFRWIWLVPPEIVATIDSRLHLVGPQDVPGEGGGAPHLHSAGLRVDQEQADALMRS